MDITFSQAQAQRVLRQRNLLALTSGILALIAALALAAAASRDREIVLQPVLTRDLSVSSQGVSKEYLELITRDSTVLMLNRTPQSLEYWVDAVLKIVHPSAYGKLKAKLLKIADDQRGSSVAQYFSIERMRVDPINLSSEVTGVLHTMVGSQEVSALKRTFRFGWIYTGVELRLVSFGALLPNGGHDASGSNPSDTGANP
jgi:conjugal transfer pilus assembly protein TraE